jgi:hypothetical protein
MPLLVFLLIGAVWAAFLLPSFFESRRRAPISATRNFQRSNELLASVAGSDAQVVMARRRQAVRRRRLLAALTFGAAVTLAVAVLTSSLFWLGATVIFDLLIGAYVTLLLMSRQRAYALALAPRIGTTPVAVEDPSAVARREAAQSSSTVRVVAG